MFYYSFVIPLSLDVLQRLWLVAVDTEAWEELSHSLPDRSGCYRLRVISTVSSEPFLQWLKLLQR